MYKFNEIEELHIELTTNCQAKCPMCARTKENGSLNPLITINDLDIDILKQSITPALFFIKRIMFCGNFGDPILYPHLIDIVDYIKKINSNIFVDIHTNGSARDTTWWKELARALPKNHSVTFGIDGLEDTHSLYRIGTNFNKIIKNAQVFIANGGIANWTYIVFKHNEHQVEPARHMAMELGFKSFQAKHTSRFLVEPWLDVKDKTGKVTHRLEFPTESNLTFIDRKTLLDYQKLVSAVDVSCEVERIKSLYIDGYGQVWPCCFIASTPYQYTKPDSPTLGFRDASVRSLNKVTEQLGDLNIKIRSIKDIVDSPEWQSLWDKNFQGPDKLHMCARTCGNFSTVKISQHYEQIVKQTEFHS